MSEQRLSLALDRLEGPDWARFERFASEFLTADFPNLRSVASPQGDEGRDAELFSPNDDQSVVLQYSVTKQWNEKIRDTAHKVKKNLSGAQVLVYVTNHQIGASADGIKRAVRDQHRLFLDVRDKSYFLARFRANDQTERAAEALAQDVVDPYLAARKVIELKGSALNSLEARAALVFLALQWEDDTRDKGLTRIAFEALIRSALRNTDAENRITGEELFAAVRGMLPDANSDELRRYFDQALNRLIKKQIRHYPKTDEFCLTHEESLAMREKLAALELQDSQFIKAIEAEVNASVHARGQKNIAVEMVVPRVRRALEQFFLGRGESFAAALASGQRKFFGSEEIRTIVISDISKQPIEKGIDPSVLADITISATEALIASSAPETQAYLRWLSNSYTLFAFLRHSPDVQAAVKKMFSHGEIWLDTSMVLPLFGEAMLDEEDRRFTRMIGAARAAGLSFRVTSGVVEETERHMNRSYACAMGIGGQWRGPIPFLFEFYIANGGARAMFATWLEQFRGKERSEDDIAQCLLEEFGIERKDLAEELEAAPADLRIAVNEIWARIHEKRREQAHTDVDPLMVRRLADHDTENYVGVIQRRKEEQPTALGFSCWWVTLDHMAFEISERLREQIQGKLPASPVMSADFLASYLSIGPMRGLLGKEIEARFPVSVDAGLIQHLTPELIALADKVRDDSKADPEFVIRRKVRDSIDQARRRIGPISGQGLRILFEQ